MRGVPAVPLLRSFLLWPVLGLLLSLPTGCALLGGRRVGPLPPPATPPPPAVVETPVQTSWEVPPRLLHMVTPVYPDSARAAGIEGQIVLQIVIDEQGRVTDVQVLSARPPGLFDEAAVMAIRQWIYEPARSGGQPIKVRLGQQIEFSLKDVKPPQPPLPPSVEEPRIIVRMRPGSGETPISMAWEEAPELIPETLVKPEYPPLALKERVEGKVILQVVIDEDGNVVEAEVLFAQPPGIFEEAAIRAIKQWKFKPAKQYDKPIKVLIAWPVDFRLPPPPPPPPPVG
jgi:TonB family protein